MQTLIASVALLGLAVAVSSPTSVIAVLLFFFATSWFWIPFTSVLPWFIVSPINKTIELILAFLLYKFLTREASRYRAFLADLSAATPP